MAFIIEIATTDYYTTKCAIEGGAHRIELCAALSEGGITPSFGTIKQCREAFDIPLFPIIRPRGGDFLYSDSEFQIMKSDIGLCREAGCDGIVTGLLKNDGRMDIDRLIRLVELAYPMEVTVHRAFDRCIDPFEAMEQIIEAGRSEE
ncbi:MAG: copper homeostasis protein CutC, partial [Flavisolibacter sp.]